MRGSQVFAALVIIALVAMGLVYLEAHGYFRDQRPTAMSRLKPDANAPKAEPPEADQASLSAPNSSGEMIGSLTPNPSPVAALAPASAATPLAASPAPMTYAPPEATTNASPMETIHQPMTATRVIYPAAGSRNVVITPIPSAQVSESQQTSGQLAAPAGTSVPAPGAVAPAKTSAATVSPTAGTTPAPAGMRTRVIYKVVYVDASGNACKATRVPVRTVNVSAAPRVHRVEHPRVETDNSWIYGAQPAPVAPRPMYVAAPSCSMMQQTASGGRMVTLPAGMTLKVALNQQLSTLDTQAGQEFQGYLVGPITYCGEVIVPAGATVQGTVARLHHRGSSAEDEAVLQLKLQALDANGFQVPVLAFSSSRRMADEVPYTTVNYMNDPNYVETARDSTRDVTLPAQSVVSFSLRSGTAVSF